MTRPNSHRFEFISEENLLYLQDMWYNGEIPVTPSLIDFMSACFEINPDDFDSINEQDPFGLNLKEWVDADVKLVVKPPEYYLSKHHLPTPSHLITDLDQVAMYCLKPAVRAIAELAVMNGIDMYQVKDQEEPTFKFRMRDECQN